MAAAYGHCNKGLPVNALILAPWHGEASCFPPDASLACLIGFEESWKTKKPRNSSPRPRPLLAHVTHARIIEPKAALALRPKKVSLGIGRNFGAVD